jgi:hypothetical protein
MIFQPKKSMLSLLYKARVHKFSKNLTANSKFEAPDWWYGASSIFRMHKYSGATVHNLTKQIQNANDTGVISINWLIIATEKEQICYFNVVLINTAECTKQIDIRVPTFVATET